MKRELTRIPLWGWATGVYGAIAVDREASASMSRNNPYHGRELPDPVVATFWRGRRTFSRP